MLGDLHPFRPQGFTRRQFIAATSLALPALAGISRAADDISTPFDEAMNTFMAERKVPGGSLAVVKDRKLVFAKGYGFADRDKQTPARPDSLFRIASISKPITAVAVLKLVEEGKLSLDARMLDLLNIEPLLENGATFDERHRAITVRHLLQHTAGWDRDKSFDPMFRSLKIAEATGTPPPAGPAAILRYMLGRQLDFDPGTRYAYSNLGYCALGRIIEKITGEAYDEYVKKVVLAPCGIRQMRIGHTLDGQQAPGEVRYYSASNGKGKPVFPGIEGDVPWPYGCFYLEAMDAHGGWLASAVDLARFAAAFHEPASCPILREPTIETMFAEPPPPMPQGRRSFYACGWSIRRVGDGKINTSHNGSLPGTATFLVRRADGISWAALFNQRSENKELPDGAIDGALHKAADSITAWPDEDLFPKFA